MPSATGARRAPETPNHGVGQRAELAEAKIRHGLCVRKEDVQLQLGCKVTLTSATPAQQPRGASVPATAEPPPILTSDPEYTRALLFHARDEPLEVVADSPEARRKGWRRIVLHGTDYPGLLHEMAGSLAQEGINIEAINTDTQKAPFGDDDLFTVDAVVEIPADADIARFKKSLDRLKQKLGVDIEVSDHEPYESVQRHK